MRNRPYKALVLIEIMMVMGLIALMTGIAMISFSAMWGNTRFKSRAEELVNTFQMAYEAAVQSDRRYEVVFDYDQNAYILREYLPLESAGPAAEESIISVGSFDDNFQLDRILYDDGLDTQKIGENREIVKTGFVAGHAGWQYGGIVVLRDRDGNPWSIVVHRLGRPVELVEGYAEMLTPLETVPF